MTQKNDLSVTAIKTIEIKIDTLIQIKCLFFMKLK